jgi:hypothetical protein
MRSIVWLYDACACVGSRAVCDDGDDTFLVEGVKVALEWVTGFTNSGVLLNNCSHTEGLNRPEIRLILVISCCNPYNVTTSLS